MCGRFTFSSPTNKVLEFVDTHFSLQDNTFMNHHHPHYNIAPTSNVLTLIPHKDSFKGGYLPWGFPLETTKTTTLFANARSETVMEKPLFRSSYRSKRCIVLADGFYEWDRKEKPSQPYYFFLPNHAIFAFAGLWTPYISSDGVKKFAVTLLTTPSKQTIMEPIHDRLPVVLSPRSIQILVKQTNTHR